MAKIIYPLNDQAPTLAGQRSPIGDQHSPTLPQAAESM